MTFKNIEKAITFENFRDFDPKRVFLDDFRAYPNNPTMGGFANFYYIDQNGKRWDDIFIWAPKCSTPFGLDIPKGGKAYKLRVKLENKEFAAKIAELEKHIISIIDQNTAKYFPLRKTPPKSVEDTLVAADQYRYIGKPSVVVKDGVTHEYAPTITLSVDHYDREDPEDQKRFEKLPTDTPYYMYKGGRSENPLIKTSHAITTPFTRPVSKGRDANGHPQFDFVPVDPWESCVKKSNVVPEFQIAFMNFTGANMSWCFKLFSAVVTPGGSRGNQPVAPPKAIYHLFDESDGASSSAHEEPVADAAAVASSSTPVVDDVPVESVPTVPGTMPSLPDIDDDF